MTSRDRLRNGEFPKAIEKALENALKNHKGLRIAEHKRRTEALRNKLSDDKPLKDILKTILTKSSSLSKLFLPGTAITSPVDEAETVGKNEKFSGKKTSNIF